MFIALSARQIAHAERQWGLTLADLAELGYAGDVHARQGAAIRIPLPTVRLWRGKLALDVPDVAWCPDTPQVVRRPGKKPKKKKYERAERSRPRVSPIVAADLPLLDDQEVPILVVEGAPKGARVRRGLREAGLPGVVVHGFGIWTLIPKGADDRHRLNPDWHAFLRPGRRVVLLPDSDAEPGGTTEQAWGEVERLLTLEGAIVERTHLDPLPDGKKCGPDDFLNRVGTLEQLLATATPVRRDVRRVVDRRQDDVLQVAAGLRRLRHLPPSTAQVATYLYQLRMLRDGHATAFEATYATVVARECGMSLSSARRALRELKRRGWIDVRHDRDRRTNHTIVRVRGGPHWGNPEALSPPATKPSLKRRTRGRVVPPSVRADLVCTACGVVGHVASIHAKDRGRLLHSDAPNGDRGVQHDHQTEHPAGVAPITGAQFEHHDRRLVHQDASNPSLFVPIEELPRTGVSRSLDWSDWPELTVKRRGEGPA